MQSICQSSIRAAEPLWEIENGIHSRNISRQLWEQVGQAVQATASTSGWSLKSPWVNDSGRNPGCTWEQGQRGIHKDKYKLEPASVTHWLKLSAVQICRTNGPVCKKQNHAGLGPQRSKRRRPSRTQRSPISMLGRQSSRSAPTRVSYSGAWCPALTFGG